jgi:hypothetical protein
MSFFKAWPRTSGAIIVSILSLGLYGVVTLISYIAH